MVPSNGRLSRRAAGDEDDEGDEGDEGVFNMQRIRPA